MGNNAIGATGNVEVQLGLFDTSTGTVLPATPVVPLSLTDVTVLRGSRPYTSSGWLLSNSANLIFIILLFSTNIVTFYYNVDVQCWLTRDNLNA